MNDTEHLLVAIETWARESTDDCKKDAKDNSRDHAFRMASSLLGYYFDKLASELRELRLELNQPDGHHPI